MSTVTPVHVGIDVSKSRLDLCILPGGQTLAVDNSEDGIKHLVALLKQQPVAMVLLEATGRYERRVASELLEAGLSVAVVNPRQARVLALVSCEPAASGHDDDDDEGCDSRSIAHQGTLGQQLSR